MATSANRSRLFPARARKSYRLEMEGRTLYLLLALMALTGVVIFYLGIVTGKALRDPNQSVPLSAEVWTTGEGARQAAGEATEEEKLAFNEGLRADEKLIEGLKVQQEETGQRTDKLISEVQKQLELEEVAPPEAPKTARADQPSQPEAPAPAKPQAPRAGAPAAQEAESGALYTVQVFSSQREQNARRLMNKLREMGFAAYLNRYEAANDKVWYRVRVGRAPQAEAEALSERLRSEAKLKEPQLRKL